MAGLTINSVSLAPAVVGPGEKLTVSVSVTNGRSAALTGARLSLYVKLEGDAEAWNPNGIYWVAREPEVTQRVAAGATATLTLTATAFPESGAFPYRDAGGERHPTPGAFSKLRALGRRAAVLRLGVRRAEWADGTAEAPSTTDTGSFVAAKGAPGYYAIDRRCLPGIAAFAVERAVVNAPEGEGATTYALTDEGTDGLLTARVTLGDDTWRSRMTLALTVGETELALNPLAALTAEGYRRDVTALSEVTLDRGYDYTFWLTFGDGYESVTAKAVAPSAFANVHLSGCETGGVAFGKFSGSAENAPLFECRYPAVLEGGLSVSGDVTVGAEALLKVVQTEAYAPGALAAGATFSATNIDVSLSGWTPIGVVGWRVNTQDMLIRTMRINDNGYLEIEGKNIGSSSRNPGIYARVLYLRTGS